MANPGLFVKLDQETFERLREAAKEDRRQPGDQAALLLKAALDDRTPTLTAGTASR